MVSTTKRVFNNKESLLQWYNYIVNSPCTTTQTRTLLHPANLHAPITHPFPLTFDKETNPRTVDHPTEKLNSIGIKID